jgi:hypothetical protein
LSAKVAAVTMFYNEPEYLPIWLRYYASQLGRENCFLVDHGSDLPGARAHAGTNIFRLPRSPQDENQRVRAISTLVNYLLNYYDWVIYGDTDEIVVADPTQYNGLVDFCSRQRSGCISCVGLNLHHCPVDEPDFDVAKSVLEQRSWVRFVSPMCKPIITSDPVHWGRGFHSASAPVTFENVFLFHLRYFDLKIGLKRLGRTRNIERKTEKDMLAAQHQHMPDGQFESIIRSAAGLPRAVAACFRIDEDPVAEVLQQARLNDGGAVTQNVFAGQLWQIPRAFHGLF